MALAKAGFKLARLGHVEGESESKTIPNSNADGAKLPFKKRPLRECPSDPAGATRAAAVPRPQPKPRPSLPNVLDSESVKKDDAAKLKQRTTSLTTYSTVNDGPFNMLSSQHDNKELNGTGMDKSSAPMEFGNYSYASVEFRPLIVTNDGAYSAPIETDGSNDDHAKSRSCSNTSVKSNNSDGDTKPVHVQQAYSVVNLPGKDHFHESRFESDFPLDEGHESGEVELRPVPPIPTSSEDVYDAVADLVTTPFNVEALYATVDKSHKNRNSTQSLEGSNSTDPEPNSQVAQDSQMFSTGSTAVGRSKFFVDIPPKRNTESPPKPPKPYNSHLSKQDDNTQVPDEVRERLNSYGRNSISTEDLMGAYVSVDAKFDGQGRKNVSCDQLDSVSTQPTESQFKRMDKRSFQKQHRRMRSHEKVVKLFNVPSLVPPTTAGSGSSKQDSLTCTDERSSGSSSAESSASPDPPLINAGTSSYQEIDIKDIAKRVEISQNDELPEGWQEVKDSGETYYWHLWSGTIQYERPVATTPSATPRPVSPLSNTDSNSLNSTSDSASERINSSNPQTPEPLPEKIKQQVISFPVHSMGWLSVEENEVEPKMWSDTVNRCIAILAEQRKDLWNTSETWGDGKDIKLNLDGESLKLYEPKAKKVLLVQPITKMRVWGVGKDDQRDFAFIARNSTSEKHKCHMFRCHGNVSGRSITNALQTICSRVLEEKRKAKERSQSPAQPAGSSLLQAPISPSVKVSAAFNEKPHLEEKKRFTAKYLGWTEVNKPSGIDVLNKAVNKLTSARLKEEWKTVLIEITPSEIKTTDCSTQSVLMKDRVRFLSFVGIARDERMCGYIVTTSPDTFLCHVFSCTPHSGAITMALEEACKLRFETFLDRQAVEAEKSDGVAAIHRQEVTRSSVKGKGMAFKTSMQGLFSKLQKKDSRKKSEPEKEVSQDLAQNEFMLKYFGCVPVTIGTGVNTVEQSVEKLSSGSMIIGILEVTPDGLTFFDSQRTALSRRVFDLDTITFCELTSDKKHFGIILSQGRGKYVCHVFQEHRTPISPPVQAILRVL